MGIYGSIFVEEHLPPCKRGLVSRKCKTPFFCLKRDKNIYAGLTKRLADFLEYCSVQLPLGRILNVARPPVHLNIHRAWQILCSNNDQLEF